MSAADATINDAEKAAKSAAGNAAAQAKRSFAEAADHARATASDAATRARKAAHDGFETVRAQSRAYLDNAGQYADEAQRYVVERVKERPLTATLAGLGVGVLLGLLLAGGSRRR